MTRSQLAKLITTLRGDDGWFHPDNEEAFQRLAGRMILAGLSPERTYEMLSSAYGIVAGEFGP